MQEKTKIRKSDLDSLQRREANKLSISVAVTCFLTGILFIYSILFIFDYGSDIGYYTLFITFLGSLLAAYSKFTKNYKLATQGFIFLVVLTVNTVCIFADGFLITKFYWLLIIPIMSLYFLNLQTTIGWVIFSFVSGALVLVLNGSSYDLKALVVFQQNEQYLDLVLQFALVTGFIFLYHKKISKLSNQVFSEIEKRHSLESRFKALTEKTNDLIYTYSKDGTLTYISPAAEKIFKKIKSGKKSHWKVPGLNEEGQLIVNKKIDMLINEFEKDVHKETIENIPILIESESKIFKIDIYNMLGVEGVDGIAIFCIDLSKDIEFQMEQEKFRARIFESSRISSIGTLASGLAHEINNPLAYIQGYTDLIGKKNDLNIKENKILKKAVESIGEGIERIQYIVGEMKEFGNYKTTDSEKIEIISFVKGISDFFSLVLGKYCVKVNFEGEGKAEVLCSKNELKQVLHNVITNGFDAIQDLGNIDGKININIIKKDFEVEIIIRDNGVGIDEDIKEKIFDAFFTRKIIGKSMGIGLTTVQSIVKKNNGRINVDSLRGKGSTFTITLPLNVN